MIATAKDPAVIRYVSIYNAYKYEMRIQSNTYKKSTLTAIKTSRNINLNCLCSINLQVFPSPGSAVILHSADSSWCTVKNI